MEKKNPILAGLFNMLVPGLGYWYVENDRGRFIKTLIIGLVAITALVVLGTVVQNLKNYPLPRGLCPGVLLLFVFVPLFMNGQKEAKHHNYVQHSADLYTARQKGDSASQLERNQSLRDKGLISDQEYDSRKNSINRKK